MWFSLTLRVGKITYGLNGQRRQKACHIALPNFPRIYPQARDITEVASCSTTKSTWCNNCVRGMRTQPLICVGCSVHYWVSCAINKGVFLRLHFRRRRQHAFASLFVDTHLPPFWGAYLSFTSVWRANSCGDSCVLDVHLSKVCWGLIFCLRKAFIF